GPAAPRDRGFFSRSIDVDLHQDTAREAWYVGAVRYGMAGLSPTRGSIEGIGLNIGENPILGRHKGIEIGLPLAALHDVEIPHIAHDQRHREVRDRRSE